MKVNFEIKEDEKCSFVALGVDKDIMNNKLAAIIKTSIEERTTAGMQIALAVEILSKKEILALASLSLVDATNKIIEKKIERERSNDTLKNLSNVMDKIAKNIEAKPQIKKVASSLMNFMEMINKARETGECDCPNCVAEREAEAKQTKLESN